MAAVEQKLLWCWEASQERSECSVEAKPTGWPSTGPAGTAATRGSTRVLGPAGRAAEGQKRMRAPGGPKGPMALSPGAHWHGAEGRQSPDAAEVFQ